MNSQKYLNFVKMSHSIIFTHNHFAYPTKLHTKKNEQLSVHKTRDSLHSPHTFKGIIASVLEVLSWFCDFYGTKARLTHSLVRCPFPPPYSGSFYHWNYQYFTNGERKRTDVSPSAQWKPEEIKERHKRYREMYWITKRIVWSLGDSQQVLNMSNNMMWNAHQQSYSQFLEWNCEKHLNLEG